MDENKIENESIKLPECDKLILSSSPHIHTGNSVSKIMLKVIIALIPVIAASIYFFGINALKIILFTAIFCVAAEVLWCLAVKKSVKATVCDGSALVTGIILGLNFGPATPWFACLIGAFLAIWLGKQIFGGIGYNPFNPAIVARIGLLIAFPAMMTTWLPNRVMIESVRHSVSQHESYNKTFLSAENYRNLQESLQNENKIDTVTCATPLSMLAEREKNTRMAYNNTFSDIDNKTARYNYFLGNMPGSLGEICTIAILLGGFLLILWKLINWRIPLFFIGTVFVLTGIINFFYPNLTPTPLFHLLTGGLMFGAFFMATDMVTSPLTNRGCILFGIGCGAITSVIRLWGNYPEGVSFAILFMNALVPFIDKLFTRRPFGSKKKKEA